MAGVQFHGLEGCGGSGDGGRGDVGKASVGKAGIGKASSIGKGQDSLSLGAAGGLIEGNLELSLGSGNLGGVLDGGRPNEVILGLDEVDGGGDGQVGGLDAESQSVSDVVGGLEDSVGIDVGVASGHASISVADLVLGRVDVGVTVLDVAELVLGLELRCGRSNGGAQGQASGIGNGDTVHIGETGNLARIGSGQELCLRGGHAGSEDNLRISSMIYLKMLLF